MRLHAERAGWSPSEIARATTDPGQARPRIDFVPQVHRCPTCEADELKIVKTKTRRVTTLAMGTFEARETILGCSRDSGCPPVRSDELALLVPPGQRYGYDLIVYAGLQRYLAGKQREEIREQLHEIKGIELSDGTVTNLCDRFLRMLETLHLLRTPYLRAALDGAWSLHIDATSDKGKGGLAIAMDGLRGWVLMSSRIPSEAGEHIRPLVDETVALFGDPLATVRDMGDGMAHAVLPLRERGIPDLICHQHFLAAVGKKLLDSLHSRLRTMLDRCRIRGDLRELLRQLRRQDVHRDGAFGPGTVRDELLATVKWVLDGEGHKELPFPFSLHHRDFVGRCQQAVYKVDAWVPTPRTAPERRAVQRLGGLVRKLDRDRRFASTVAEIDERYAAFGELRDVLRLSHGEMLRQTAGPPQADFAVLDQQRLKSVERDVDDYVAELRHRRDANPHHDDQRVTEGIVLGYLERERDRLFGHPVVRDDDGTALAVVPRTNNEPEYFFGLGKRLLRRRVGRANLGRDMQQQPPQVALALNLRFPDYVRILCGSLDNLPTAFARLDPEAVRNVTLQRDHRDSKLDRLIQALVKQERDDREAEQPHIGG